MSFKNEYSRDQLIEKDYEDIINRIPSPLLLWKKQDDSFLCVGYNHAFDKYFFRSGKKLLGKKIEQIDIKFDIISLLRKCFNSKSTLKKEIKYKSKNLTLNLLLQIVFIPPNLILIEIEDITEKKKAIIQLEASELKYRTLFEEALNPILIVNDDGNYVDANEAASKFLETTREDIIGRNVFDYSPPGFVEQHREEHSPFYDRRTLETQYYVNGKIKVLLLNVVPFVHKGNRFLYGIGQDITELKQIQRKLTESEEKYKDAFNQAQFYRDIVIHDIRNMLQNIKSSIFMSQYYLNDTFEIGQILEINSLITQQVNRAEKLIKNVNTLSKIDKAEPELHKIDIFPCLTDAINYIHKSFPQGRIDITINSSKKSYLVLANDLLQDVFENILLNAIKYNENDVIEILIEISQEKINNKLYNIIQIMDNGIGISNNMKKKIFHKKEKGKGGKGMGVGLSLVKLAMDLYDGQIYVKNRVKDDYTKGSNFVLSFPIPS